MGGKEMKLVAPYTLLLLSWLLRAYDLLQERKGVVEKPLIWGSDIAVLFLTLIWLGLLALSLFLGYGVGGFKIVLVLLSLYFVVFPLFLGNLFKKMFG